MLRTWLSVVCFGLASVSLGCAGGGEVTGGDGGRRDGGSADGATDTGAHDSGRRDSAVIMCPTGEHACGGGCVEDQPNEPENGCRFGCGEACPTPADGVPSCNSAGACDFACEAPFHRDGANCVCAAATCDDLGYECGSPDNGCGMPLDCGTCASGMCLMGVCGCTPDPHESNDGSAAATRGAELDDSADPDVSLSDYTIDEATDTDWLVFHIVDGTDGGNPRINVRLSGVPVGSDYDLAAFFACDTGSDASTCNTGTTLDSVIGHGCVSSHAGSVEETVEIASDCSHISLDDPGSLYVRVTAPTWGGSCAPYQLTIMVR
jgi:hypothetical protein